MIPIDVQVNSSKIKIKVMSVSHTLCNWYCPRSRSKGRSKVKPTLHMFGKGGISVLQTSIFYIWLLQALTNPHWSFLFCYNNNCRHWPTPSDVLYFAVPGTDQSPSDVLWRGDQRLGLIHGPECHPFPENDGVQGPHYTVHHPSTVLWSLWYVWWVGSLSILWTANILYSNMTWLVSPIKSTDTIPGI